MDFKLELNLQEKKKENVVCAHTVTGQFEPPKNHFGVGMTSLGISLDHTNY